MGRDASSTEQFWKAPSFCYDGEDRVTFNLQGTGFFRLIFHTGAKVKERTEQGPLIEDKSGLLEWAGSDRAIMKFTDKLDIEAKKADLVDIVAKWIQVT
ncbi:hypothetical protein GCM10010912_13340 [Paenibacillus albidus]|uniref:DUF1801 domain-containing protein n=1 Tax=Paenibacillus albidus TaxID=2041023 RepID=A0A917FDR0_9BACL|nr:DUF1801 domain-containing protein [Paenibacillus albidus]GGF69529.1 hypothetical protein GCM10010912_13340 [Paenibacillus albidus]